MRHALAFCFAAALHLSTAQAESYPALFDVSGVGSDDILNIRADGDATSRVLGIFRPDTTDIEVLRANPDGTWGLVNVGEGTGWVSLAYLRRQPGQDDRSPPAIRRCVGTEPFWSLNIDPPRMTFATPDDPATDGLVAGLHRSTSRGDRFAFTGHLQSPDAGPLEVVMAIRREICTDGMSDREFGFDVDMLVSDPDAADGLRRSRLYSGCCTLYSAP